MSLPAPSLQPTARRISHRPTQPWRVGCGSRAPRSFPRSIGTAADTAALQERARIARELHDSVSQTLYAIKLTASRALHQLEQSDAKQMRHLLGDVVGLADTGQSELRSLLANLRSDQLTSGGLNADLARLAAGQALDVRLSLADEPDVPATIREALVLIAREALHNVVTHSGANHVDLVLETDSDCLMLLIVDNGRGFDPGVRRPGHFGLLSMRERATAIGGWLTLDSAEGVGTRIRVCVPRT